MPFTPDPSLQPEPEEDRGSLAGAAVKTLGVGALRDIVAPAAEISGELAGDNEGTGSGINTLIGKHARSIAGAIDQTIPEARRRDRDAKFFPGPGEPSVFEHPGSSFVMKGAEMAPTLGALALTKGLGGQAALGAVQGGGGFLSQQAGDVEKATDDELAQKYPDFAQNITWGLPSGMARKLLLAKLQDPASLGLATAGGAASALGVGPAMHGASGVLRGAGAGAVGGAAGMAVGGGAGNAAQQLAEIQAGSRKEFDWGAAATAIGEGAATGAVVGGTAGAIGGAISGRARILKPKVEKTLEGNTPDPAQESALTSDTPPETVAPVPSAVGPQAGGENPAPQTGGVLPTAGRPRSLNEILAAKQAELDTQGSAKPPEVAATAPVAEGEQAALPPQVPLIPRPIHEAPLPDLVPGGPIRETPPRTPAVETPRAPDVAGEMAPLRPDVARTGEPTAVEAPRPPEGGEAGAPRLAEPVVEAAAKQPVLRQEPPAQVIPERVIPEQPKAALPVAEAAPVEGQPTGNVQAEPKPAPPTTFAEAVPKVAETLGASPKSSTTVKTARRLVRTKKTAAQREAEQAAATEEANRILAEAGKPKVLPTEATPEVKAAKEKATIDEEAAQVRAKEADRQRDRRRNAHGANDERAKRVVEGLWEGVDNAERNTQDQAAVAGDPKAMEAVIGRAKRLALNAEEEGVSIGERSTHRKDDPEAGNITPWTNFVRQSRAFHQVANALIRGPMTKERAIKLRDYVRGYVESEGALRRGDTEEAGAVQRARSQKRTVQLDESRAGVSATSEPLADITGEPINAPKNIKPSISDLLTSHETVHPDVPETERGKTITTEEGEQQRAPEGEHTSDINPRFAAKPEFWKAVNGEKAHRLQDILRGWHAAIPKGDVIGERLRGIVNRLAKDYGNTKIIVLGDKDFDHYTPDAAGTYFYPSDPSFAAGSNGVVVVRDGSTAHTVIHEMVHAATAREISRNPELLGDVHRLMDDVLRHDDRVGDQYGFTNAREFLAEALSNVEFQEYLRTVPVSHRVAASTHGFARNAWDKLVRAVAKGIGMGREDVNALDAAMRLSDEVMAQNEMSRDMVALGGEDGRPGYLSGADYYMPSSQARVEGREARGSVIKGEQYINDRMDLPTDRVRDYFQERRKETSEWKLRVRRTLDKVTSLTQLGNTSDGQFGEAQPQRKLVESMLKAGTHRDALMEQDDPLIRDLDTAARKYTGSGLWARFEDNLINQTSGNVFGDRDLAGQKHLGKNAAAGMPGKAAHAEISKETQAIFKAAPELRALQNRLFDYFRERQSAEALQGIENILKVASEDGMGSPELARRIHENKMTEADKAVIGSDAMLTALNGMKALKVKGGPYVPQVRRGDFVVQGRHEIPTTGKELRRLNEAGAETPAGKVFEFGNKEDTEAFLSQLNGLAATAERVHVDPDTGLDYYVEDGKRKAIGGGGGGEERYRVHVEDQHVEFHERLKDAKDAREALIAQGLKDVPQVDIKRFNAAQAGANFIPTQISNMTKALEKRANFQKLDPAAQREMIRHLQEMGIAAMSSTRAQTRRLPRRNVAGANHDITTNTAQYSSSSAGYLGRLKYQPETDKYLKEMQDYTDQAAKSYDKGVNPNEDTQALRRAKLQEFERRVYNTRDPEPSTLFHRVGTRLLQMSQMDKLISPAFHVLNASQVAMITAPVLAARHGIKAIGAIAQAYKDIGAGSALGQGLRDTGKAFRSNARMTDYTKRYMDRLEDPGERAMLQHLKDTGLLSRDAGMEVGKVIQRDAGLAGRMLDRTDLMARQVGTAIESINRTVTGLAAYRLELARNGGDHDAALKYAHETVHDTQGDYSTVNAPPLFKGPVGRLVFQFKKYPQLVYYLLAKNAGAALKGDKQAMATFAGLMASNMVAAGALGAIPGSEIVHAAMLAAGMTGLTDKKYGDMEQGFRSGAANLFGKPAAEVFSRGVPRMLGMDWSSRTGWDNLMLSGQDPKSFKAADLWAWFAQNMAGAPASYIMDLTQAAQAAARGDLVEASRLAVPIKAYADSVGAAQMLDHGRRTGAGRQVMDPIRWDQAVMKVIGFNPAGVAEQGEQGRAIRGDIAERTDTRNKLIGNWVSANPADKQAMYRQVLDWNKGQPENAQIKFKDLTDAMYRRKKQETGPNYKKGIAYTKRTRDIEGTNAFYNTSP